MNHVESGKKNGITDRYETISPSNSVFNLIPSSIPESDRSEALELSSIDSLERTERSIPFLTTTNPLPTGSKSLPSSSKRKTAVPISSGLASSRMRGIVEYSTCQFIRSWEKIDGMYSNAMVDWIVEQSDYSHFDVTIVTTASYNRLFILPIFASRWNG